MDMDPTADALAAAICHGNEVAGPNNDGWKASGEDLNKDGWETSGEDASIPNTNSKRIYNKVGFRKRKICLSRHKKGQQKNNT